MISTFSCADHLRRRSTPVSTSIRRGRGGADTSLVSSLRSTLWSKRCRLMDRHYAHGALRAERGGRLPLTEGSSPSCDATPAFVPAIVENEPRPAAAPVLPATVVAIGTAGSDPASIEIAFGG